MCLWEFKLWILKSLSISCVRCCPFDFIRHKMDLEMDSLLSPARCRDSRSLTGWEPSGAFWVSHWGCAELTLPQKEGLTASVRTQGTHFCENMTSKYKKKGTRIQKETFVCPIWLTWSGKDLKNWLFLWFVFTEGRTAKRGSRRESRAS